MLSTQINFDMDTRSDAVKYACTDILKTALKNRRHHLKKKHFDNVPANLVSVKSLDKNVTDAEWQRLVKMWSTPRHKVFILLFYVKEFIVSMLTIVLVLSCHVHTIAI